jgi:(E)-4-hydroxy-3-methylbut-2-enyl-diphosphate synthase
VPTRRDAEALPEIRRRMAAERLRVPLVADIHFNPRLALDVTPHVEKVRINPGNYVDQKKFAVREYSDAEYAAELTRVEETLVPLIRALKQHGRSLRIGVNHGSLSDRVMNRHGDTPLGMVECAMEYLRILARHGYHETIVSMKSSNPRVVIQAYRLLALRMAEEGMDYPLHLGVTEAGDGLDGRVKSAVGIGSLLCDGLGDTIRVSLTEASANEIPAARALVAALESLRSAPAWPEQAFRAAIGSARRPTDRIQIGAVSVGGSEPVAFFAGGAAAAQDAAGLETARGEGFDGALPIDQPAPNGDAFAPWLLLDERDLKRDGGENLLPRQSAPPRLLLLRSDHPLYPVRRLAGLLADRGLRWPIGVVLPAAGRGTGSQARMLATAAEVGNLASDGLLDALVCSSHDAGSPEAEFGRTLLQASRLRTYKTEFISCPSCGRTLFDLEETTARIKARTSHLAGVKIAVMGCIVNGPGEMADADFGYVGGAPGKVALYKGHTIVERGVPTEQAVERLVQLIKDEGKWVEPGAGLPNDA